MALMQTQAEAGRPRMSVIVLVGQERARGERCLRSLLGQANVDRLEILLVDVGATGAGPLPGSDHPRVRLLRRPSTRSFGALQAEAVELARAPIVAFIEEHCVALPGWSEALLRAHERDAAGVGGERHNPAPREPLASFIHLLDDGPWTAPAVAGPTRDLPAGNVAYKREILMRYAERLGVYLQSEPLLHERLHRDGQRLHVEPAARYLHEYDTDLGEVCARWFWQGYVGGAARAELLDWRTRRRAAHIWHSVKAVARGPATLRKLIAGDPGRGRVVAANAAAALLFLLVPPLGDIAGTALGGHGLRDRVLHHLVNARRPPRPL